LTGDVLRIGIEPFQMELLTAQSEVHQRNSTVGWTIFRRNSLCDNDMCRRDFQIAGCCRRQGNPTPSE
jgi:hypothetical protein